MATIKEQVVNFVIQALNENPDGLRYNQLYNYVLEKSNQAINQNTISGQLVQIEKISSNQVVKVSKGFYRLTTQLESENQGANKSKSLDLKSKVQEKDFYQSFATWLVTDLDDCTKAEVVGGATFGDKWATPDVLGVLKSKPGDMVKFEPEIVAAEIKISGGESLITALGQACSYRLFAHRSYIVVPKQANKSDLDRLDSLCLLFGIGLVVFDMENPDNPDFLIKTRALTHKPDMFYLNHYLGKSGFGDKLLS